MNKTAQHYLVLLAQFIAVVLLAISSALLWFVFPRGYFEARELWVEIHKWVGVALGSTVVLHVLLNRNWLIKTTRRYAGCLVDIFRCPLQADRETEKRHR